VKILTFFSIKCYGKVKRRDRHEYTDCIQKDTIPKEAKAKKYIDTKQSNKGTIKIQKTKHKTIT